MKHVFILLILLLLVITGCSHPTTDTAGTEQRIVIDPSTRKETLPVWLWYAGTRAYWMKKTFFERFPETTVYRHTLDEEVAARDGCAHLWRELKSKDGRVDRYLDDLLAVQQSGFIREYVWFYFREPDWSKPANLRLSDFDQWQDIHLKSHTPETKAYAHSVKNTD